MKVKLVKYDPEWKSLFEIEKEKLIKIINSKEIKVEHIGSTSIPDIYSKPIIDIMIGVEEDKQLNNNINSIISLGYTYVQKYEICMPFRRYFFKPKNLDYNFQRQLVLMIQMSIKKIRIVFTSIWLKLIQISG